MWQRCTETAVSHTRHIFKWVVYFKYFGAQPVWKFNQLTCELKKKKNQREITWSRRQKRRGARSSGGGGLIDEDLRLLSGQLAVTAGKKTEPWPHLRAFAWRRQRKSTASALPIHKGRWAATDGKRTVRDLRRRCEKRRRWKQSARSPPSADRAFHSHLIRCKCEAFALKLTPHRTPPLPRLPHLHLGRSDLLQMSQMADKV